MGLVIREYLAFSPLIHTSVLNSHCSASNPVLDLRYWKLMQDILMSVSTIGSKASSGSDVWLITLLNRVPLLPIVLSVLSNSPSLPAQKRDELYFPCSKSLALVWSLASPKFSPDNLLECFGAMLKVLNEETAVSGGTTGLVEICMLVTFSLHAALSNFTNKKKVCLTLCKALIPYRVDDAIHSYAKLS